MLKRYAKSKIVGRFCANYWFLALLCLVFCVGVFGLIKNEKSMSNVENRALARFEHFTLKKFLDGSFQDNFENAMSDQFVMSAKIRTTYRQAMQKMPTFGIDSAVCKNHYIEVSNGVGENRRAFFNCEDYLVGYPLKVDDTNKQAILKHIENYNRINSQIGAYYYYVDNFFGFNFENNEREEFRSIFEENLVGESGLRFFEFEDFEDYKQYFYKTDHHWNYAGSYEGYLEIAEMLGVKNVLVPKGIYTNHDLYYGTSSRLVQNYEPEEEFWFYDFDFPEHDVYIGGVKSVYGHYDDYKSGNYSKGKTTNYYHLVYGDDAGEVVFDYHQENKDNLLIISDSYGDPLKELLALHFNKTHSVDLRHYKKITGKDFAFDEYVKEYNIGKVLFIISPTFLTKDDRNQGLESVGGSS